MTIQLTTDQRNQLKAALTQREGGINITGQVHLDSRGIPTLGPGVALGTLSANNTLELLSAVY